MAYYLLLRRTGWVAFLLGLTITCFGQKLNFHNYNVEDGLLQSQVTDICQDADDNIWVATLGGISRYDGSSFTNLSETEGLVDNFTTCLLADDKKNIWIGTQTGVSVYNGSVFTNYSVSNNGYNNYIKKILQDRTGNVWILTAGNFYLQQNRHFIRQFIASDSNRSVSFIVLDSKGVLCAFVQQEGIYCYNNDHWQLTFPLSGSSKQEHFHTMLFDAQNNGQCYLLTAKKIYSFGKAGFKEDSLFAGLGDEGIMNMYRNRSSGFWLTTNKGLYKRSPGKTISLSLENGYTNQGTKIVFEDREGNTWFGTNGAGLFRFSDQPFVDFDHFRSVNNSVAMAITEGEDNKIYIGTDGSGLSVYDGSGFTNYKIPSSNELDQHIMGFWHGLKNNICFWTSADGLWNVNKGRIQKILAPGYSDCVNAVFPDPAGGLWIAGCKGCYYVTGGHTRMAFKGYCSKLLRISQDTILVACMKGVRLIVHQKEVVDVDDSLINKAHVITMMNDSNYYFLGTANLGLLICNKKTHTSRRIAKLEGLNSNFVYSVIRDRNGQVWLGTGWGVNKLLLNGDGDVGRIISYAKTGDISSGECNQDAAVCDHNGNLWFGSSLGLLKYSIRPDSFSNYSPPVVLQSVKLFSNELHKGPFTDSLSNWYHIPLHLKLPHDENNLSFTYGSSSFEQNKRISYQYMLEGLELNYSQLSTNRFVVYPGLPPGKYIFKVRAFLDAAGYSSKIIAFPFEISKAFYQTFWFRLLLLTLLSSLLVFILRFRLRQRVKRSLEIESIKNAENAKVRNRTAEDFHDEIGNTLTRIQVLSDVLQAKLNEQGTENSSLIKKIQENISILYNGTRDIIWALNPESDKITAIADRLAVTAVEMFEDTGIVCKIENHIPLSEGRSLPGDYGRNILMIMKETMSNVLKHARASDILLKMELTDHKSLEFLVRDHGIGYDAGSAKKGNGLENMYKRANRINAVYSLMGKAGCGTSALLAVTIPNEPV